MTRLGDSHKRRRTSRADVDRRALEAQLVRDTSGEVILLVAEHHLDQVVAGIAIDGVVPGRPDRVLEFVCGDLPLARADRSTIRQVLINLLSNAAKYAKKDGPIRIEMGASADEDFNTYWVRDFGVGFDMRYADKLFGVFQRLHRADEFEGTGVGLAIVQRIVHRHGGRVWAEGAIDRGATFRFTLGEGVKT